MLKILYILFKEGEINISKLAKETKLNYSTLLKYIEILEQKKLIEVIRGDRSKIVRLNYANPKVIILKNLFEELEDI
ncbi:ArsR family transcriptional regulator [Sulfolobus sp. S-194]|nr:ArsR family transcriptional regulator [Sulfolobus sp. S-194]